MAKRKDEVYFQLRLPLVLHEKLKQSMAEDGNFLSMNQEILVRLKKSFEEIEVKKKEEPIQRKAAS